MITTPIVPTAASGSFTNPAIRIMREADHPDDSRHFVVREIEIEGPRHAEKCEFEEDEPEAADQQIARDVGVFAAVEEDAGSGEEDEGGRAEMRDPAGEEDSWCGASGRKARINSHVIDGHEDHDGAADEVDRLNARFRRRSYGGRRSKEGSVHAIAPLARALLNEHAPSSIRLDEQDVFSVPRRHLRVTR